MCLTCPAKKMLRRHTQLAFEGSLHFITTVTFIRGLWFIEPELCREILQIFEQYRRKFALQCLGYVLMPDHLHALLVQSDTSPCLAHFMQAFKRLTSEQCRPGNYSNVHLWRRRYDDVPIPGEIAARKRLEYMHENPVRRGLVTLPVDYFWSSVRDYHEISTGPIELFIL
jgi:putative transposase